MRKTVSFITALILCVNLCGCGGEKECIHNWDDADCTTPKTCELCGETRGKAKGHDWEDATCTKKKTCSVCSITEGEVLEHKWEEATCTSAKTCSLCGKTEGEKLEHKWVDATCTSAKTCSVCAATEGEALGHTEGEWEMISYDAVKATAVNVKKCTVCNEEIERKEEAMTKLHDGSTYLISPAAFNDRFNDKLADINKTGYTSALIEYNDLCACAISKNYNTQGLILFENGNDAIYATQENDGIFTDVLLLVDMDDTETVAVVLVVLIAACDPALSIDDARNAAGILLSMREVSKNGIIYRCAASNGDLLISACVS